MGHLLTPTVLPLKGNNYLHINKQHIKKMHTYLFRNKDSIVTNILCIDTKIAHKKGKTMDKQYWTLLAITRFVFIFNHLYFIDLAVILFFYVDIFK
jgi:hypothetical protein